MRLRTAALGAAFLAGLAVDTWADAEEIVIKVENGFGGFATEVHLKAIYT